jgi:hypothetical protein
MQDCTNVLNKLQKTRVWSEIPPHVIGNNIYLCLLQVGNALTDDFNDQLGIFQFMWSSGMISDQTFKLLNLLCDFQSVEHPSKSCEKILEIADNELGNIDPYSVFTPPCHGSANQRVKRTHVSLPFLLLLLFNLCFIFVFKDPNIATRHNIEHH